MEKTAGAAGNQRRDLRPHHPRERRIYEVPGGRGKRDAGGNPDCLPLYHPGGPPPSPCGPQLLRRRQEKRPEAQAASRAGGRAGGGGRRSGTRSGPTWSKTAPTPRPGPAWRTWSGATTPCRKSPARWTSCAAGWSLWKRRTAPWRSSPRRPLSWSPCAKSWSSCVRKTSALRQGRGHPGEREPAGGAGKSWRRTTLP